MPVDVIEHVNLIGQDGNEIDLIIDEDHPQTTKKEIWGWYLYEIANQPYSRYIRYMRKYAIDLINTTPALLFLVTYQLC